MEKIRLGRTGLMVSRSGFGAIPIQRLDKNDAGRFNTLVPIWGIQFERELDEFITLEKNPPPLDDAMRRVITRNRAELAGDFCRGCGYCLPCPAGIPISQAARISLLLRRTLVSRFLTDEWKRDMAKIRECQECGHCREQCP